MSGQGLTVEQLNAMDVGQIVVDLDDKSREWTKQQAGTWWADGGWVSAGVLAATGDLRRKEECRMLRAELVQLTDDSHEGPELRDALRDILDRYFPGENS